MSEGLSVERDSVRHIGEVKADPHGYVVGPGSLHPSGNTYGPLHGDRIAKIDKEELLDMLEMFIYDSGDGRSWEEEYDYKGNSSSNDVSHPFYELTADDILPWLEPNKRIAHPVHGSDTDNNFMKNDDGETFTCWRCTYGMGVGCGVNPQQLLAMMEIGNRLGDHACEEIRREWRSDPKLHYLGWKKAVEDGLVVSLHIPYTVARGYAVKHGIITKSDDLIGDDYYDVINALEYKAISEQRSDVIG
jgi:hypothetical protein